MISINFYQLINYHIYFPYIDKIKIPREYPEGMVPLQQRPASSEEVANAILFLASNDASYVTGTEIYVDGALSLFQG